MNKKILLVEDEAIIAMTTAKMLEKHDFEVVTAHKGEKAVEIVDSDPDISLILMDIDLGKGMDGTETAEKILTHHDIPVVFLSSHTEPEVVKKTEKITSYGYVVKNSGDTVLLASIRMAFRLYEANQQIKEREDALIDEKERLKEHIEVIEERKRIDNLRNIHLLALYGKMDFPQSDLLDYVLNASLEITNSHFAFVGLLNEDTSVMTIHRWSTEAMESCSITDKPIEFPIEEAGIWGDAVRERQPIIINDYETDTRATKHGTPAGHVKIKRFLCVPIFDGNRIVAVGAVANKEIPYDIADVDSISFLYDKMWSLIKQQQADLKLQESEQKWRALVESNPDFVAIHDETGRFLYMNRYAEGFSEDDVIGTNAYEYMSEESKQLFQQKEKECLETWSVQKFEHHAAGEKGVFSCYENFLVPFVENETEKRVIVVSRDITERKQLEQNLRKNEKNLRTTLNSIGDAVISTDLEGKIYRINPVAEKLTGCSADTAHGKKLNEIFHIINADSREIVDNPVEKVIQSGKIVGLANHTVLISKDGTEYQIADSAAPIKDDEGKINGVVLVFRDVTEEYKKDRKLKERVKELDCLYKIAEIVEQPNISVNTILQQTAEAIPPSWQYPEICECRITLYENSFQTNNFSGTKWKLSSDIAIEGEVVGKVEVYYLYERPIIDEGPFSKEERKLIDAIVERLGRVIERKQAEENLRSIEWMLSNKTSNKETYFPEYGDVSELNRDGLILSSVGKKQLRSIAAEYLDLLETSTAIYEKNGDYALGIFTSGWCQLMDSASRKLCNTEANQKALESGKWLCHESCWKDAHLSMKESRPVEIECKGGIKMYAVPVRANGEIVGAINFGYGNPPTDETELKKLANRYKIPIHELKKQAEEYKPRPQFIIDYAKERIQTAAKTLGYIIENNLIKEKISQEKLYLRTILQATTEGFWVVDSKRNITQVNDAYCLMSKYSKEEFQHMKINDLDAEEKPEETDARIWRIIQSGNEVFETKHRRKDGSVFDTEISATFLNVYGGQFICFCRDITERKQAEKALKESERQKALVLNNTLEKFTFYDLDLNIIWANKSSADSVGMTQEEIVGKHCYEIWHKKKVPCEGCIVLKAKKTKQPQSGETTTPDGKIWSLRGYPVLDDQGEVVNLIELGMDVTAKKQTELKFESYVTNSPTPIFIANSKGDYTFINPAASELLGYTEDELLSMNIKDIAHPDEYKRNFQTFSQLLVGKHVHQEVSLLHNDGSKVYVILDALMLDETNIIAYCTDITERNQAEEALRKSEEKNSAILHALPDLMFIQDSAGTYLDYYSSNKEDLYVQPEQIIGQKMQNILPQEISQHLFPLIEKTLSTKEVQIGEYEITISGEKRAYEARFSPFDENNVISIMRDITEQMQAEKALKKEQHYFQSILNALPDTVYFKDKNHRFIRVNRTKVKEVNSTYEDIIGKTDFDFFPEKLAQKCLADDEYVLNTGKSIIHKEEEIVSDKNRKVVLFSKFPLKDESENIIGTMGISSNISELKETEIKLQEALKEKDFLMKELNHRIKNNLFMVSSLISLKDSETEIDLSDIQHQIEAISLIHEKLYKTENVTDINCRDYFDDLLNSIFTSFTTRQVRVEKDIEDIYVSTKTAMSLGLIVNEIATNAIKYGFTDKEEAVFTIEMKKEKENNQYKLTLSNTGNPFPEDIDIKSTNTLGLRLINALIAQLDGTIELQKKPKPVFTIRFPL